ncbi:MAG: ABC transporter substrate-binding protein [Hyphomicrobiaceae bacterium]|nr:ABC transporter substrate-binding protein [Hyphomicrobiaceae bacterium]
MYQVEAKPSSVQEDVHGRKSADGGIRWRSVTRAVTATVVAALLVASVQVSAVAEVRGGAVLSFMNDLARTAIEANKTVDRSELEKLIRGNVDVESIGDYSLGSYIADLSGADVETYYEAVTNFMARYAAMQSRHYRIEKADFYRPKYHKGGAITLKSRITLASGTSYRVKWKIVEADGKFKVLDASIFGFWLTPFQKRLFQSYVRDNDHDVQALVNVLAQ